MKLRGWFWLLLILAVAPALLTEISRELTTALLRVLLGLIEGGGL